MASNTKEKILDAALELFAEKGYSGTNIKDIADSVGIVKSALYRHFGSKEDICNAVSEQMASYYNEHFGSVDNLPGIPKTAKELEEMTLHMINFTIHDKRIVQMRKVLHTEQFRDEKIRDFASNYFLYDTEAIFTKIFAEMMKNGCLKENDPALLAFSYTTPITSLIHLCDREPEKEAEAIQKARSFIQHFIKEYGIVDYQ